MTNDLLRTHYVNLVLSGNRLPYDLEREFLAMTSCTYTLIDWYVDWFDFCQVAKRYGFENEHRFLPQSYINLTQSFYRRQVILLEKEHATPPRTRIVSFHVFIKNVEFYWGRPTVAP
jgi:hypothetical protein